MGFTCAVGDRWASVGANAYTIDRRILLPRAAFHGPCSPDAREPPWCYIAFEKAADDRVPVSFRHARNGKTL